MTFRQRLDLGFANLGRHVVKHSLATISICFLLVAAPPALTPTVAVDRPSAG